MRSLALRRRPQAAQCEAGKTSDWLAGRRSMQTLRKLATTRPSSMQKTTPRPNILLSILPLLAGIVNTGLFIRGLEGAKPLQKILTAEVVCQVYGRNFPVSLRVPDLSGRSNLRASTEYQSRLLRASPAKELVRPACAKASAEASEQVSLAMRGIDCHSRESGNPKEGMRGSG